MLTKLITTVEATLTIVETLAITCNKGAKLLEKEVDLMAVKQEERMAIARQEYADAANNIGIVL